MAKKLSKRYQLHADPIGLKATQHGIFALPIMALSAEEAESLTDALTTLLPHDHAIIIKSSTQWTLEFPIKPDISTTPLKKIIHKEISHFLPSGNEGGHWRQLMTEMQMLLHQHPINQNRRSADKQTIDSVWFWVPSRWRL